MQIPRTSSPRQRGCGQLGMTKRKNFGGVGNQGLYQGIASAMPQEPWIMPALAAGALCPAARSCEVRAEGTAKISGSRAKIR